MNYELFIARRLLSGKHRGKRVSNPITRIALFSITLGMIVMIVAIMVVKGFQNEVAGKVIGFGNHIKISNFDSNDSYEENPIDRNQEFLSVLASYPEIKNIHAYATKAGILKTEEEIEGVVLKGVDSGYNFDYFNRHLVEGSIFTFEDSVKSNEILISKKLCDLLKLKLDDELLVYFVQQPPRIRKFSVKGIYETGLSEFDEIYVFCDIRHIQRLNDWNENLVGGYEVLLNNFDDLDEMHARIYNDVGFQYDARSIKEMYPQIFNWLELSNLNVIIIISLIILVAGINMISTLLIIIFENTSMIGILKSMGASGFSIRKLFLYIASYLIILGLFWGNLLGVSICLIQKFTGIVKLPQESYYVSVVPVDFSWTNLLFLNTGTIIVCILMMILPSMIISRIRPARSIRFE